MITPIDNSAEQCDLIEQALLTNETIGPGTFKVCRPVNVPPGQTIEGSGIGRTIIQLLPPEDPLKTLPGVILLGEGSKASRLTTLSRETLCNGIVSDGVNYTTITDCEVLHRSAHTYGIWAHNSKNVQILNCLVDGGTTLLNNSIEQEGIELYGVENALVANCKVKNIGRSAINLFTERETEIGNTVVRDCIVHASSHGIYVGSCDEAANKVWKTFIEKNIVRGCVIDIKVVSGAKGIVTVVFKDNVYDTFEVNTRGTVKVTGLK